MVQPSNDHFFYFAYGSNLLKRRILINNPSSIFIGRGRLDNHSLDFVKYSSNWQGAVSTIVPKEDEIVWGAIWKVHNDDLPALDRQEGVATKDYFPRTVNILTSDGIRARCRTYQNYTKPPARRAGEELPVNRRPSITYMNCIVRGAIECELPRDYIDKLKKIPTNGKYASSEIRNILNV